MSPNMRRTGRRGFYTSWIQTTATLGLFLSLLVILLVQASMSADDFKAYGWRIPFLVSVLLLAVSVWIRLQLRESPAFLKMKAEGTHSKAPLSEAFGQWANAKWAILALFGLVAGQAVVWYSRSVLCAVLPDRRAEGRRLHAPTCWWPGRCCRAPSASSCSAGCPTRSAASRSFWGLPARRADLLSDLQVSHGITANPALTKAHETVQVVVVADPADCSFQFNPTGLSKFVNSLRCREGARSPARR